MKKHIRYLLIFVLLLLCISNLNAQTDPLTLKLAYTGKDYRSFMKNNRNYWFGFSCFYDWQHFTNAANAHWMSDMQILGFDYSIFWYPLLLDVGARMKHFGKINSPYQIPVFQSTKINKYGVGTFISLSIFPLPYIPALKRTQEYVVPYAGIGYQQESLTGWGVNDYSYYRLNLSSWYWQAGCKIFLSDFVPFDLFVEYAHTLNPDKIRNYEWLRVGMVLRYSDLFKSTSHKSYSKSLKSIE